jgi:hypothetical protein
VLIAQAIAEGLMIVTRDKRFNDYGVALLTAQQGHDHEDSSQPLAARQR